MSFVRTSSFDDRIRYIESLGQRETARPVAQETLPAACPDGKAVCESVAEASKTPPAQPTAPPVVQNGVYTLEFDGVPVRFRREYCVLWIAGTDMVSAIGIKPVFNWRQYHMSEEAVRKLPVPSGRVVYFCTIPAAIQFCQSGRPEHAEKRLAFMEWFAGTALPYLRSEAPSIPVEKTVLSDSAFTREYLGVPVRIRIIDGEAWVARMDMRAALGFPGHNTYNIPEDCRRIMSDCSDAMRPAVFISMKGLEHFCSHGSPKRRERGKAFMEWLKVAAIPATKGGD